MPEVPPETPVPEPDREPPGEVPPEVWAKWADELHEYLWRHAGPADPDDGAALDAEFDGYASSSGIDAAGRSPKGSYVFPPAYTSIVVRRVAAAQTESCEPGPESWRVEVDHHWWGRWREAHARLADRRQHQAVGYRYCYRDPRTGERLTLVQIGELLGREERWVRDQLRAARQQMVMWFLVAGTLDGRCDRRGVWG